MTRSNSLYRNRSSSLDAIETLTGDLSFAQVKEQMRNMKVNSNYAVKQMMIQEYVKQEKLRQSQEAAELYDEDEKYVDQKTDIMNTLRQYPSTDASAQLHDPGRVTA
jgi:hypothetical protein